MAERLSKTPESGMTQAQTERGSERFSLTRVLTGIAIGAVALPAAGFGLMSSLTGLPDLWQTEIATGAVLAVLGGVVGGSIGAGRFRL